MMTATREQVQFDVFISHASEDKQSFVRHLAHELRILNVRVWFDEYVMNLGDSLRDRIEDGLSRSRFGIVVLSPAFFRKAWALKELDGLYAQEVERGINMILPVWHNIGLEDLRALAPTLAGRLGISSSLGARAVANQIWAVIKHSSATTDAPTSLVYSFGIVRRSYLLVTSRWVGQFFPDDRDVRSIFEWNQVTPFEYDDTIPIQHIVRAGEAVQPGTLLGVVCSEYFGGSVVLAGIVGQFVRYLVAPGATVGFDDVIAEIAT